MPPFTVLHVCMGNICRSPMAEHLLAQAIGDESTVHSHSVGTGGWHAGEPMDPPAAEQLRARGVDPTKFRARKLTTAHVDGSDLILTATREQSEIVVSMRPDAHPRTFVLGEFARLVSQLDTSGLPAAPTYDRAIALAAAASAVRGTAAPLPSDDLDDPWGRGPAYFSKTADKISEHLHPLIMSLRGRVPNLLINRKGAGHEAAT